MKPKQSNPAERRMPLHTKNVTFCFQPDQVTRLECTGCLSTVYFANGKTHTVTKTLKSFIALLSGHGFLRVHHHESFVNNCYIFAR
jgi:DNA-binding LytR/AlgR family response regulator